MDDSLQKKLDQLDDRIQKARSTSETHGTIEKPTEQSDNPGALKSARAGSEFLANVIAGGLLGFGIDWFFHTKPLFVIVCMVLGFVSGVYRANEAMKKNAAESKNNP